jgi:zona occludens toxin
VIYFTTGANGAGKTLLTLWDVRQQQIKENRPVYYHGFDMVESKAAEFGWQKFDPPKWQDLPDGSICIMDECQGYMPAGKTATNEPQWVQDMAVHRRKRGFDFWAIAPHPALVSPFFRRLCATPSWHRHIKRTFGADLVSELKFGTPDLKCEDPGAGERAQVSMVPYRKEVYAWYRSASLHTGKRKLPKAVYVFAAAVVLVPVLGYAAFSMLPGGSASKAKTSTPDLAAPTAQQAKTAAPMSAVEYVASYVPRIPGLPHTAPRFDEVTKPTEAPYPAACVSMGDKCDCYTQQGTKLTTPRQTCLQIVAGGFFMDWKPQQLSPAQPTPVEKPSTAVPPSNQVQARGTDGLS